ncbi:EAL domain-containing protein [Erythrobacter sp. SCSIO 43205]|uniref:putative bifunctional diguanylate cyclase/phosphodiesterase n=1 Tax=Erythrobacter sp. SCSIO 43205 TaxID=2779361 RepID=UPI001CA9D6C3|nr:EAL domain-containing protein [Erythrobacter sp. SCSIO 43205]UAB79138.1 EAL domain-containing protein [Erythrobacter sp. SCSIO 43205]
MASVRSSSTANVQADLTQSSVGEIYRPILRGYFVVYALYYSLMVVLNWLSMEINRDFLMLETATVLATLYALAGSWMMRKSQPDIATQALLLGMNLLVICNVWIALTIDFRPEKLTYFIIMSMLFALASPSFRQSIVAIALSLGAMVSFADRLDSATLSAFGFLSFAAAMSSLAIAFYLRKAITRIALANNQARAELSEAMALSAEMRDQSLSDSLTKLPNRRAFFEALGRVVSAYDEQLPENSAREDQTWLVLLDLDGFKAVNDVHGHKAGDLLLQAISERLSEFAKEGAHISRMGGDEFNMILTGIADEEELYDRCSALLLELAAPYYIEGRQVRVSCSAGCVQFDPAQPSEAQISNADYALMVAKKQGKNQTVIFDREHENEAKVRLEIETALRGANLADELSIVFQPQVRLGDNAVVGAEVLARWTSPAVGTIAPDRFIRIAEESGLVTNITLVVVEKALAEVKDWSAKLPISINLSAHDLMSDPVIEQIIGLIDESGVGSSMFEFEVTETAMMGDIQKATANLVRLAQAGFSIALDDFGSGYSNFSYLRSLPIARLKVDRSFIDDPTDPMAEKVLSSLVGMARVLGVKCLVEGVEDEFSLLMAKRAGAEHVQGYLFSRPVSGSDMRKALEMGASMAENATGPALRA